MNEDMFPTTSTKIQVDQPATVHVDHFLLATKLTVPPVRSDVVARPQLIGKLQLRSPLTLLAAAAGFGKTTLLSAAIQQYQWPTVWLSLDSGDDDITRFWSYVFTGLESIQP
ncbi:MAG TPA: hypothetical protein VFB12_05405, partial [Ktedonobacteraceae bacterium]|nr:hypothetical protein [Ktedonobacteraceae bacterium]